jgi:C1A family cysteine protease
MNGPCVGGLPVYDDAAWEFWKKKNGDSFLGGHAVSIVGYNEKGFIIRNSWGRSYAEKGYVLLPYDDILSFTELWTIID